MLFENRIDAGRRLAARMAGLKGHDCVVLALPRGGVPVASIVASALDAPLDLLMVRKIGAPQHPELAIGSVIDGSAPIIVQDSELMRLTGTTSQAFDRICADELAEIERRHKFYLGDRPPQNLAGRIAIVVDDGLATGNTMRAALQAARLRQPARLIMAVPVAPAETLQEFRHLADEIVCLATPEPFGAVGRFYDDFRPTTDGEVIQLLQENAAAHGQGGKALAQQGS
jgi:putative phosphoribosyl transferase